MEWNILFIGPVGAGKTQAIRSISDIDVIDTDEQTTDETRSLKSNTTVAMDLGTLNLAGQDRLRLYGAPGQERFDFMWDILLEQSKGVILVLSHHAANPLADLDHFLRALEERTVRRHLPMVIAITHTDLEPGRPLCMYQEYLQRRGGCAISDAMPPVLEMDARDRAHVHAALVAMTAQLEMAERYPRPLSSSVHRWHPATG